MPKPTPRSLAQLLGGLHEDLRRLFVERNQATQSRRRGVLQRQLLLGLELLWKIEEQLLLPALHGALPGSLPMLRRVSDELELMRDLALLTTQTHSDNREMTLTVLEGLARLHFARVADLVDAAPADGVDSPALEDEVRGLLARWRHELRENGEVEDEDRDPVGLPPR